MKKKLRIGVIGLGRIYPRHADDSIHKIDELELVAVCDNDAQKAKEMGKKEGVPSYTDYKKLIADTNVDVVSICTPNGLHHEMGMAVAKSGKHCVMEKPISQTYTEAKKLVEVFDDSKGTLFPVLQVRYNPAIQVLREYIQKGALGNIFSGAITIRWTRPQEYFDESDWKGTADMDGGSLLTQAIHYIDVAQYVLGPVKKVYGKFTRAALDIETEDTAHAILEFASGARLNLEFTVATYPHNLECSLTVLGKQGTIKIGGIAMNACELWEVKNAPQPHIPEGLMPNQYAGGMYVGSCPNHYFVYENLVNTIIKGKESFLNGSDALESLRIIDGIKESSEKGVEVELKK